MKKIGLIFNFLILLSTLNGFTIYRDSLDNGLIILSSEAHKIPMVEVRLIVKAGSFYDPSGKEGLANLTVRMLLRGTETRSGDEFLEEIEYRGANINANVYEDYAEIAARSLSKDLETILGLLAECVQKPSFKVEEFSRLQRQVHSQIVSQLDDPFYAGEVAFRKLLFSDYPLNHEPSGFDSTVNQIDITDVKNFFTSYYAPNNAFIVIVGDFNSDSMKMMVEKYFSPWVKREVPEVSLRIPELNGKKGKLIKRDISQSYIFFGFYGPDNRAVDWIPARMMNYVLGGSGLTSRLATEIREKRGLAYSVFSYFNRFCHGGYFIAGVQTKNESANEAVELIIKEISRIRKDITEEELNRAKRFYTGNFPLNFDTYREMANFVTRVEIEGLGLDYAERYERLINKVKIEDIKAAAEKYMKLDNFCLVIVGNIDESSISIEGLDWVK
ncbi:MAG: insulinase family protein [candidate division WOR-3 bacterium]|nr:insulinase family protein [candidate division WOR-3 bacterium]